MKRPCVVGMGMMVRLVVFGTCRCLVWRFAQNIFESQLLLVFLAHFGTSCGVFMTRVRKVLVMLYDEMPVGRFMTAFILVLDRVQLLTYSELVLPHY